MIQFCFFLFYLLPACLMIKKRKTVWETSKFTAELKRKNLFFFSILSCFPSPESKYYLNLGSSCLLS